VSFIFFYLQEHYKQLVTLVTDAQNEYKEMVAIYQQEVIKANTPSAVKYCFFIAFYTGVKSGFKIKEASNLQYCTLL